MALETFTLVGPGATAGVLADSLSRAGKTVRLLAKDESQAAAIRKDGLKVDGRAVELDAVSADAERLGTSDAVVFCVKSPKLASAIGAARPLAGPDTTVLSIQNGLAHVAPLRRAFGSRAVFGAAYFGAKREAGWKVRRLGGRRIELGTSGRNKERAKVLADVLRAAGWDCALGPEAEVLWSKLVLNAAINPLGALAGVPNGELASRPALKDLLERAAREAASLSPVPPRLKRADAAAVRLCKATAGNFNSMAQDVAAGRRTEADAILLPFLRRTHDPASDAPVLFGFYRFLKGLERGR
jgi:2-dehydropantoate 2-reductase